LVRGAIVLAGCFLGSVAVAAEETNRTDFVFTENFENFDTTRWSNIKDSQTVQVVPLGRNGGLRAQVAATLDKDTGGYLYKMLKPGLETAYLRFYVKFEAEHGYIHHFVKLIGYNPPTPWPQGHAGEKPTGKDFFSAGIEPWGNWGKLPPPGAWHFYTYHAAMNRAPDGKYWGNDYNPDPPVPVVRDQWICVEVMVKCNAPDQADGEQALWIDGRLAGHWKGILWRSDPKLNVNGFAIESYVTEQAARHNQATSPRKTNRCWFDDIVLSRSYIGPDVLVLTGCDAPKHVSDEAFKREFDLRNAQTMMASEYLGEKDGKVFLMRKTLSLFNKKKWNEEVWFTETNTLDLTTLDQMKKVR
jgi:hypothetical protein